MSVPITSPVNYKGRYTPTDKHVSILVDKDDPIIDRCATLRCIGDWSHADFQRIMAFIIEEFAERYGPRSRGSIWTVAEGGMEIAEQVVTGFADIAINTPVKLIQNASTGTLLWKSHGPAPHLRVLASVPQDDRMMFAIAPKLGCKTFADIRKKKPKLKIILGPDNDDNLVGFVCHRYLEAHGVSVETIKSWGGEVVYSNRPEECRVPCQDPVLGFNAVINEAIMTPWWDALIDGPQAFIPLPAE